MAKKVDYCILIGRFQVFHLNHKAIVDTALEQAEKVIILLGSANRPRSIKNPFTKNERQLMIESVYANTPDSKRLIVSGISDYLYNDQKWALEVQNIVDNLIENDGKDPDEVTIGITGNRDDHSSWYLNMFPQWEHITPKLLEGKIKDIHATDIREILFTKETTDSRKLMQPLVPKEIFRYLEEFKNTHEFLQLAGEYGYIKDYKKSWAKAPYPVTFVTVDAVVIQSGHILLIKRRAAPGKGLYAMPGGFLDQNETIEDGMLRELHEETKIKVPVPVLRGNIRARKVYDNVERSMRGRTITNAFLIELPSGELPRIKGSDDAEKAIWLPISDLKAENMFEDHYDIITNMLGRI